MQLLALIIHETGENTPIWNERAHGFGWHLYAFSARMTWTRFSTWKFSKRRAFGIQQNWKRKASQLSMLTVANLSFTSEAYAAIRVIFSHTLFCAPVGSLHALSVACTATKARIRVHYGIMEFSSRLCCSERRLRSQVKLSLKLRAIKTPLQQKWSISYLDETKAVSLLID